MSTFFVSLNALFTMSNVLTIMMLTYPYPTLKFFLRLIFKLFVVLMSYELYSQCQLKLHRPPIYNCPLIYFPRI